jgi:hypothetical protein
MFRSASKKFRDLVMSEFGFLLTEFGFEEDRAASKKKEFIVWLVSPTTRIVVEGINWGGSARVAFGTTGGPFENFDLWDLASIRCPQLVPAESAPLPGQPERLKELATILRTYAEDVLRGDLSVGPQVRALQQKRLEEWEKRQTERGARRPLPPQE